jgi:DNA repair protein RecN (Recombination protein N)
MFRHLSIKNHILIEELEIDLTSGLTIITGETGAGKSILLGALGLLTGQRADSSTLLDKQLKCVVEGMFAIAGSGLEEFFFVQRSGLRPGHHTAT